MANVPVGLVRGGAPEPNGPKPAATDQPGLKEQPEFRRKQSLCADNARPGKPQRAAERVVPGGCRHPSVPSAQVNRMWLCDGPVTRKDGARGASAGLFLAQIEPPATVKYLPVSPCHPLRSAPLKSDSGRSDAGNSPPSVAPTVSSSPPPPSESRSTSSALVSTAPGAGFKMRQQCCSHHREDAERAATS